MDFERLIALTRGGNDCCYVCGSEPVEPKPPLILKCAQCRKLGTQATDQLDRIGVGVLLGARGHRRRIPTIGARSPWKRRSLRKPSPVCVAGTTGAASCALIWTRVSILRQDKRPFVVEAKQRQVRLSPNCDLARRRSKQTGLTIRKSDC